MRHYRRPWSQRGPQQCEECGYLYLPGHGHQCPDGESAREGGDG